MATPYTPPSTPPSPSSALISRARPFFESWVWGLGPFGPVLFLVLSTYLPTFPHLLPISGVPLLLAHSLVHLLLI